MMRGRCLRIFVGFTNSALRITVKRKYMKKTFFILVLGLMSLTTFAQKQVTVKAGTLIPFQSVNTVRAADVDEGQKLNFRVARDIIVDGVTAIPYGSMVSATVLKAKKSSWWGTRGRLAASITEVILPNGDAVPITNCNFEIKGKNRTALSVVLFLFVTIPACAITGSKAEMPAGYEVVGNVASTVTVRVD